MRKYTSVAARPSCSISGRLRKVCETMISGQMRAAAWTSEINSYGCIVYNHPTNYAQQDVLAS